jgi:hypothetical protein
MPYFVSVTSFASPPSQQATQHETASNVPDDGPGEHLGAALATYAVVYDLASDSAHGILLCFASMDVDAAYSNAAEDETLLNKVTDHCKTHARAIKGMFAIHLPSSISCRRYMYQTIQYLNARFPMPMICTTSKVLILHPSIIHHLRLYLRFYFLFCLSCVPMPYLVSMTSFACPSSQQATQHETTSNVAADSRDNAAAEHRRVALATNAVANDFLADSVHGVFSAHTAHDLTADDAHPIPADVAATDFAAHTTASIASAPARVRIRRNISCALHQRVSILM